MNAGQAESEGITIYEGKDTKEDRNVSNTDEGKTIIPDFIGGHAICLADANGRRGDAIYDGTAIVVYVISDGTFARNVKGRCICGGRPNDAGRSRTRETL